MGPRNWVVEAADDGGGCMNGRTDPRDTVAFSSSKNDPVAPWFKRLRYTAYAVARHAA